MQMIKQRFFFRVAWLPSSRGYIKQNNTGFCKSVDEIVMIMDTMLCHKVFYALFLLL